MTFLKIFLLALFLISPLSSFSQERNVDKGIVHYFWGDEYDQFGMPVCKKFIQNKQIEVDVDYNECDLIIIPIYLWGDDFEDKYHDHPEILDPKSCYRLTPNRLILERDVNKEQCIAFQGFKSKWNTKKQRCDQFNIKPYPIYRTSVKREIDHTTQKVDNIIVEDKTLIKSWSVIPIKNQSSDLYQKNVNADFCRREEPGLIRWNNERQQCERVSFINGELYENLDILFCIEQLVSNTCDVVPYISVPFAQEFFKDLLTSIPIKSNNANVQRHIDQNIIDVFAYKIKKHHKEIATVAADDYSNKVIDGFDEKVIEKLRKQKNTINEVDESFFSKIILRRENKKAIESAKKEFINYMDLNLLSNAKQDIPKILAGILEAVNSALDEKKWEIAEKQISGYMNKYSSTFFGNQPSAIQKNRALESFKKYLNLLNSNKYK